MILSQSFRSGLVTSVIFNIISKGLVFLVNIIVVERYYLSGQTDIYFFLFTYGVLIVTFFSSLCTTVIVPGMMHIGETNARNAQEFLNKLYSQFWLYLIILLVPFLFFPVQLFGFISKFKESELTANDFTIRLAIVATFLQCITAFINELLNAKKYFIFPAVVATMNSILIILTVYFFSNTNNISIIFLANIAAFSISIGLQLWILTTNLNWRFRQSDIYTKISTEYYKKLIMTAIGNSFTVASAYIPFYLFSGEKEGWLTSLGISQRIADIPTSLIFAQLSSVMAIKFTELAVINDRTRLNEIFIKSSHVLIFISVPISLLTSYFSVEIVNILFRHSKDISLNSANLLQIICLSSPFIAMNTLISRIFLAIQNIKFAFLYQCFFNLLLSLVCIVSFSIWGPMGFAFGYLSTALLSFLIIRILLNKIASFIKYELILVYALKVIALNTIILAFIHLINHAFNLQEVNQYLRLAILAGAYTFILYSANLGFRLNDDIDGWATNLIKRIRNT